MGKTKASPLSPVDPSTIDDSHEKEQTASWVSRQITGSLTGRILKSSYESLKATGNSVVCLSPWGDQTPLILPCIRFRDLAVESVLAATGGTASIATPLGDALAPAAGSSSIVVDAVSNIGFTVADDLITGQPVDNAIEAIQKMKTKEGTKTTAAKNISVTLKHKISTKDAALGFFRSSQHKDSDLFLKIKDYLDIEKGWFSPYLFASNRRPVIPRAIHPDFVFCHGPFLQGDYAIGQRLLQESSTVVNFSNSELTPLSPADEQSSKDDSTKHSKFKLSAVTNKLKRSKDDETKTTSAEPATESTTHDDLGDTPSEPTSDPRNMVILALGIQPHRKLWSSSARPEESLINYILFNGCPAIVIPIQAGSPLLAWSAFTLEHLWKVNVPTELTERRQPTSEDELEKLLRITYEFVEFCVEWDRFEYEGKDGKEAGLKEALRGLLVAAIQTRDCDEIKKDVDTQRGGIAMWRIP
ncbi:hypothetical protein K435DRAFT_915429 [Dendrothele bispora CBS 962.96]|uniref:Uncharacterized protein n=1 Tax=Dendrothele bispora (strain CBS 962.96) TaxID=1314807 RepID=A0A4S8LJ41_DENBC|nr:hypothetical protein K435DRAFT_915429 [Dendrothele bispora CBS 962.96]